MISSITITTYEARALSPLSTITLEMRTYPNMLSSGEVMIKKAGPLLLAASLQNPMALSKNISA